MIHIVFEQENVTALQNAISLDESLQGDIIEIKDEQRATRLEEIGGNRY